jgi:hypothetical protein
LTFLSAQFVYSQNIEKAVALNEAGGAIIKLMELDPEFNTRQNFNTALSYLEKAEAEDPENKAVIHNIGMLCYNWTVSLTKKSDSVQDEEYDEFHAEMVVHGKKANHYLQKHEALSKATPSPSSAE